MQLKPKLRPRLERIDIGNNIGKIRKCICREKKLSELAI